MSFKWLKKRVCDSSYNYQDIIENVLYFIPNSNVFRPKIINEFDTINLIEKSGNSICRFGDGEIELIIGNSIPYQKYDKKLSDRLRNILLNSQENLLVGVNYFYFYPEYDPKLSQLQKDFLFNAVPKHRRDLIKYMDSDKQYCAAEFTGIKDPNNKMYENYFDVLRNTWKNKNIAIVCCKEAKEKLQYDIFDNSKNSHYIFCKNINSWDDYDNIMNQCNALTKDTIVILLCGPAGKVIAADLTKLEYRALDLGHIAKSYDFYRKSLEPSSSNVFDFFSPDVADNSGH